MKKYMKVLALALALTMLLSMSVFAADFEVTGVTATIDEELPKFDLETAAEDGMYLLLILNGTDTLPDKDNILYVNQENASGGTVSFKGVYPKDIADSTIYLAGEALDKLTPVGAITLLEPEYTLGDVDKNTAVDMDDVVALLRHVLKAEEITDSAALAAGEVEVDGELNMDDVVKLMKYVLHAIDTLK